MGLSNKFSCEPGSFPCCRNPHRFFSFRSFETLFAHAGTLGCRVCLAPSCSSWFIHMQMWHHPLRQPPPFCESSPFWLPISTPPTSLNECFFFNSLVVRLVCSLIFYQFWLFFVFKFVVLHLVIRGAKCVYLPMPPSCPEIQIACSLNGVGSEVKWSWPTGRIALLVLDQKIPDWLIKITFLEEAETAIRSGITVFCCV